MAFADYGPILLYHTGHNVLSIPNHRPQPGFTATYRALTGRDDATARAILEDSSGGPDPPLPERGRAQHLHAPDGGSGHLYERLVDGSRPPGCARSPWTTGALRS